MIIRIGKLSCQSLTNPYISKYVDWTRETCYFRNQDSISAHPFELDQIPSFESYIDILESCPFSEIELEHEYNPEDQFGNSILFLVSILTPVFLPEFNFTFSSQY